MNRHRRRQQAAKKKGNLPMNRGDLGSSPPSSPKEAQVGAPQPSQDSPQGGPLGGIAEEARGLINSGSPVPEQPESQTISDPVLKQAEMKIESQILPKYQKAYMKTVVAGLKIAMNQNGQLMRSLQKSQDPVIDCARGAVNLALIMFKESRNTMPPQALAPAAATLMIKALDFCNQSGLIKVAEPELDRASIEFTNYLLHRWNLTPQKMQVLAEHVHRVMSDPNQVELLARKAGVTRDPRTLTMQPGGQPPPPNPTAPPGGRPNNGV